ncbi:ABC transporter substrate-binding protein [Rhodococcus rhodochrous]|uniref:ABC transporter substrate-binding protein n=1 Tax=Rhodococcus rhodochrous KG-21 TaxID=1441923 RepID=A0A0M8PHB2_RHORH|nr:ABC transporter substrate-binding protein [Rhodococcus rhodochrous]KOS56326.1 ABC transporter substrate-binding protein [Rhodococcus rhodochrous KG-21]
MTTPASPLRVGSAMPDPPFEFYERDRPVGFDIDLTRALARRLGRRWEFVPHEGDDFETIFDELASGRFDVVASGTTVTGPRRERAAFCAPYFGSGQSLAVDTARHPAVRGVADLTGLTVGVQQGNTSEPVVKRLLAEGRIGGIRVYAYHEIDRALDELSTGGCDAFMKLGPVLRWLTRDRPHLDVVEYGITREEIAVAVRLGDNVLRGELEDAQRALAQDGTLDALVSRWLAPDDGTSPGTR